MHRLAPRASAIQRLAALLLFFAIAPAAQAAAIPFTAQLALKIVVLDPVLVNGGGIATVNGSGGGVHIASLQLPANAVQTAAAVLPVTDPTVAPIVGVELSVANGVGNFSGSGGAMPLPGIAKICLFGPVACGAPTANVSVPLTVVGQGGAAFASAAVNLTVSGAPWTTGTAAVGSITAMGSRHGPASATSSTAAASGQLQLVTPVLISTNIGSSAVIPAFALLTLHFVPEPGTMLLIGGGLSLLAAIGRRRLLAERR